MGLDLGGSLAAWELRVGFQCFAEAFTWPLKWQFICRSGRAITDEWEMCIFI